MANVLYVRNTRPNAVLIRVNGVKYTVERRGSREDSTALPGDWRDEPVVSTFLQQGILEEISKDTFMQLAARPEPNVVEVNGRPKRELGVTEVPLKKKSDEVNIPINDPAESRTPYVITDEDLRKSTPLRSPRPEFSDAVPTTAEDLQKIEEARRAAETNPGGVDFPESETEQLKNQVNELTALVRQLLADKESTAAVAEDTVEEEEVVEEKPKAAAKKPAAKKASTAKKPAAKRGRPKKSE